MQIQDATVEVEGQSTRVLVEQFGAVDHSRLGRAVKRLGAEELADVEDALELDLAGR